MTGGYDPAHFAALYAVEDRHFWFRARNRIIAKLAAQAAAKFGADCRVLEIGCGNGNVLHVLERVCPGGAIGMDLYAEGLAYARQRCRCPLLQADLARAPFSTTFHMIGMFDVLEHIADDHSALRAVHNMLEPHGKLLLTVPAQPSLWSAFDEQSGHFRRYEKEGLAYTLQECGYKIVYLTGYFAAIYPLLWLSRQLSRNHSPKDGPHAAVTRELRMVPVLNGLLWLALLPESWWIGRGRRLPLGTSLLAVAERE
ncbi:MAG: class I SAM-dependent methyltransferase [Bryobacteraceae bacterium]